SALKDTSRLNGVLARRTRLPPWLQAGTYVCAKPDSTAGPVGQPLHPFHRRDALPRGTFNDGADGGDDAEDEEHSACNRRKRSRQNTGQTWQAAYRRTVDTHGHHLS